MANRVADASDASNSVLQAEAAKTPYGPIVAGDIIIDASTGGANMFLNDIGSRFSTARAGARIWIVGEPISGYANNLSGVDIIHLENNGTLQTVFGNTEANRTWIVPLSQVKLFNNGTNDSYTIKVGDIRHVGIDGETDDWPGLRDGLTGYHRGTYGFWLNREGQYESSGMSILVEETNVESIHIRGVEMEHGFAGIRLWSQNVNITPKCLIERIYRHDSRSGEALYVGMTSGNASLPTMDQVIVRDCIFARCAAETVQVQQTLGTAASFIGNYVSYAAAVDFKSPFQANQDGALQIAPLEGNIVYGDAIVDGAGTNMMNIFGDADKGTGGQSPIVFRNMLFCNGRNYGVQIQGSTGNSNIFSFEDIYWRNFVNDHDEVPGYTVQNYIFTDNNGGGTLRAKNLVKDNTKTNMFEVAGDYEKVDAEQVDLTMTAPDYVAPGTDGEETSEWERWAYKIGPIGTDQGGTIDYTVGTLVINFEENVEAKFYRCTSAYTTAPWASFDTSTGINATTDVITTDAAHGFTTADAKNYQKQAGILYTNQTDDIGIDIGDVVYVRVLTTTTLTLHPTANDATNDTNKIDLSAGTGETHALTELTPRQDTARWSQIQWDSALVPNYASGYNGTPAYDYPPDVLTLTKTCPWNKKGMGLTFNEQIEDYSMYRWQWAKDDGGSPSSTVRTIPGAYSKVLDIADYSYLVTDVHIRFGVRVKSTDGRFADDWQYDEWNQLS